MTRIYRMGRKGEIGTLEMGRYAKVLDLLVGVNRNGEYEERIKKLEQVAGNL